MAARTKVFVDIVTKSDGKEPGTGLKKFAVGAGIATAALVVLVRAGKEWAKAASDAEEIGSKYATIFRDIRGEAEGVASTFAESFGLAGSTAKELLGNTADLLTGLGFTQEGALDLSEQVNTLAADLASFSNFAGGTAGASEALTKALLGEAESAKALGIVINQNTKEYKDAIKFYTEVEGKTLLQAKAFTALQFATEQSGNAIGDVARTFNSTANVTRRYEESIKELKEGLGVAINEGVTPFKIALIGLANAYTEVIVQQNTAASFIKNFSSGAIEAGMSLSQLEETLEALQQKAREGGRGALREEIRAVEALIGAYGIQDTFLIKAADSAQILADAEADAADKVLAKTELSNTAMELLEQFRVDGLTAQEKEIELIQNQINFWSQYRDIAGGEEVFQALAAQREELKGINEELEEAFEFQTDLMGLEEERNSLLEAGASLKKELLADEAEALEVLIDGYETLGATIFGVASGPLEAIGEALAGSEDGWANAGKAAIGAIAGIVSGLGEQAAIQAAIAFAIGDFVGGGLLVAAAIAATVAAGAISAQASSFATGGSFITDGPVNVGGNALGDNASGQERVTVEPLGGSGGNNSTGQIMILRVGDRDLKAVVQGWIDNRALHSSRGGAI